MEKTLKKSGFKIHVIGTLILIITICQSHPKDVISALIWDSVAKSVSPIFRNLYTLKKAIFGSKVGNTASLGILSNDKLD